MIRYAVLIIYCLYLLLIPCRRHIHILEQMEYRPERYVLWYRDNLGNLLRMLLPVEHSRLPLAYTARAKRLYALAALLIVAYALLAGVVIKSALWNTLLLLAGFLFVPDLVFLANLLLLPLESRR